MLDRINNRVYGSDKEQSMRSAKANLDLMIENKSVFSYLPNGKKILAKVLSIKEYLDRENDLTDPQLSFVNNGLIEKFWCGMAIAKKDPELSGIKGMRHDNKKTLRF